MKINELKLVESPLSSSVLDDVDNWITQNGYQKLGSGADAVAVLDPSSGHVMKLFVGETGVSMRRALIGFRMFYEFCKQQPNNIYLPKFYSDIETITIANNKIKYIEMERLKKYTLLGRNWTIIDDLITNDNTPWDSLVNEPFKTKYGLRDATIKMLNEPGKEKEKWRGFHDTLMKLRKFKGVTKFNRIAIYDFDANNTMMRPDGTPVITDPFISQP